MRILLDTSIWIECNDDTQFRQTLDSLRAKHTLVSSETVAQEIAEATDFLAQRDPSKAERLKQLYQAAASEVIPTTDEVRVMASQYEDKGRDVGLPSGKMKADLAIVAESVVGFVDVMLTLNRKTMSSDYAKVVFIIVNQAQGLRTPHFITEKDAIRKLALAS